jgi:hypothetical protein
MGAGALAALGSGLGVTPGNIAPKPLQTGTGIAGATNLTQNPDGSVSGRLSSQDLQNNLNQTPTGFPNLTPQQQAYNAQQQSSSLSQSSVRLQSPDGSETQSVPANQAQYYISKGAKVVA